MSQGLDYTGVYSLYEDRENSGRLESEQTNCKMDTIW